MALGCAVPDALIPQLGAVAVEDDYMVLVDIDHPLEKDLHRQLRPCCVKETFH